MILNYIWIGFILIAFLFAVIQSIPGLEIYNPLIWEKIVKALFGMAETGFEISIGLTGVLCLWMGIMKIGENGGAIQILTKIVNPLFTKIFPDIPKNHPAQGSIIMNFSANMLGLDNAATPLGLKAMQQLQDINQEKSIASNPMIMFFGTEHIRVNLNSCNSNGISNSTRCGRPNRCISTHINCNLYFLLNRVNNCFYHSKNKFI